MKILVPMDGSAAALRALDFAIRRVTKNDGMIRLVNIQQPAPPSVSVFVGGDAMETLYRDEAERALAPARERLAEAGVKFEEDTRHGAIGDTIAADSAENRCDEIIMGSRGMGAFSSVLLGSVAMRVLQLANMPVTIVK
ncbi:MAG TPA: universal stress protein [Paracoccaceae bacterium]|nr:universal stress protein [Paracoccaceae bacterium]